MKWTRLIKSIDLKMTKNRGGTTTGPLPTITSYTDNSTPYKIDLYWYDNTRSENIVKKHIRIILLQWIRYAEEQVDYIMNNFVHIEKTKLGRGAEIWESDKSYTVEIVGNKEELPNYERL